MIKVDAGELSGQAAVIRRFRKLLARQSECFHCYLTVLDKQRKIIESGSTEDLLTHVELEEQAVAGIFSLQKVIDPLEVMYQNGNFFDDDISFIKTALEDMKSRTITQSKKNRELLSGRMSRIRSQIAALRNNPLALNIRSVYGNAVTAALIDIKG